MSKERNRKIFSVDIARGEAYMMLKNFRSRCKKRKFEFNLDLNYVTDLLKEFCKNNYHVWSINNPFKPSIDRIDNSKGYIKGNIRVVWMIENYCKSSSFNDEQVIEFCKRKLNLL